jgi:hypothetical protein
MCRAPSGAPGRANTGGGDSRCSPAPVGGRRRRDGAGYGIELGCGINLGRGAQVDPSVSAVVHALRSLYFKHEKDFAEFYKSSLLYLAFISSDALPADVKMVSVPARARPLAGGALALPEPTCLQTVGGGRVVCLLEWA